MRVASYRLQATRLDEMDLVGAVDADRTTSAFRWIMIGATDDSEFIIQIGLSDTLRAVIARTAEEYERAGDWVTFDALAYEAAERNVTFDLREVFWLPHSLGGMWQDEKVSLT
jgi:hypothetical protein